MNENPESSNRVPVAGLAVDACSASLTRYETCEMELAHYRLARHPQAQAEAIARHYLAHAATAQHLLKIIEMARHTEHTPDVESAIKYLTDQIRTNHRRDLGIELSWPNVAYQPHGGKATHERK